MPKGRLLPEQKHQGVYDYSRLESIRTDLIKNRSQFERKWEEAATYTDLHRWRRHSSDDHSGERKDQRIFRNTAGRALRIFQSGMMNGNTPRSRPWFQLTSLGGARKYSVQLYLRQVTEIIERFFHISNLYRVLPGLYKDLGIFSNGAFFMLPDPKYGFMFYPISVGQYCISSGQDGRVSTFSRDYSLSVRQVVERFGVLKKDGHIDWENSLNGWIKELWDTQQYEERISLTNIIYPNEMAKQNPVDALDRPFLSYTYISYSHGGSGTPNQIWPNMRNSMLRKLGDMINGEDKNNFILETSGYEYFPVIAARWEEIPDEAYGVSGPMELAIADVKTLQEEQEYRLEAVAKQVRPSFIGPASLQKYRASTAAGGMTYFDEYDGQQMRRLYEIDPRIEGLIKSQEEGDTFVNQAFFVDLFQALSQESPKSHVSVAEIQKRASEALQLVGPPLSQLSEDVNEKLIENAFFLLSRMGIIEQPDFDQTGAIVPEYISVLAQATKVSQLTTMERVVNFTASTAEVLQNPSLLKIFRKGGEDLIRDYAHTAGMNPMKLESEADFEEIVVNEQEAMAEREVEEEQMQQATRAKELSQAKVGGEEESLLDRELANEEEQAA